LILTGQLNELQQVCAATKVASYFVYIAEAHALDEWPVGNKFNLSYPSTKQTQTLVDRQEIVRKFQSLFPSQLKEWELYVDDPGIIGITTGITITGTSGTFGTGIFEATFKPWPIGIYYIRQNRLLHVVPIPLGIPNLNPLLQLLRSRS